MADQMSLTGILNDEKPAPREPADAPKDPADASPPAESKAPAVDRPTSKRKDWQEREQTAQGKVRDPNTGQFVAKPEAAAPADDKKDPAAPPAKELAAAPAKPAAPAAAAPQQEFTEKERAFLRAAQEERTKRQTLEKELEAYRTGKTPPGGPAAEPKKFWDDPEGALAKHRDEARQEAQSIAINTRLNTAEMIARSRHADFDEKVAVFREALTKAGPNEAVLAQQWLSAPDPAMFAYNFGKNQMEFQQVGNLDGLKEKLVKETEARVRAQVEAEFKQKQEALDKERAALPGSLSDARSSGVNRQRLGRTDRRWRTS
jgi:hypothetical protein